MFQEPKSASRERCVKLLAATCAKWQLSLKTCATTTLVVLQELVGPDVPDSDRGVGPGRRHARAARVECDVIHEAAVLEIRVNAFLAVSARKILR